MPPESERTVSEQAPTPSDPSDGVRDNIARQVEQITLKRIAGDALVLPMLPATANRIFAVLGDARCSPRKTSETVQQDALLTVRVLRQVPASSFGKDKKVTLDEAIARLGTRALRSTLYEAAMLPLFVSRDPKIAEALAGLWAHALAVAQLARDLATLGGLGDPDVAYLAGLLHDLGKPVVATVLLAAEQQMAPTRKKPWIGVADWVAVVERVHRKVGVALAEKWDLPAPVVSCVRDSSEYDNSDRASPLNLVVLANALAKRERLQVGTVDAQDVEAIIMIGRSLLGVRDELLNKVCAGIRDRSELF